MKKALAILAALALVASAASAQVTVGGWGRGIFAVSNSGAKNATTWAGNMPSWDWGGLNAAGANGPRIGVTLAGSAEKIGFQIDLNGDGGSINAGDQQLIWVKPIDQIKISLGRVQVDTLRGNASFGSFNWYRSYGDGSFGEDFTFARISTGWFDSALSDNKQGLVVEVTPIEGLYIAAALRDVKGNKNIQDADAAKGKVEIKRTYASEIGTVLANGQYAIGYTIAGVGTIRAQYIGFYDGQLANLGAGFPDLNKGTVQAAFKLTAVENLYADVGFDMSLVEKSPMTFSLYANYKVAAATIHASGRVKVPNTGDMGMYFGAGLDYGFDGGIGVNADVRYTNKALAGTTKDVITGMVGVTESLGNGLVGIAVEVKSGDDVGFAVPVRFEYWF